MHLAFIWENAHFAVHLATALALFAAWWIYADAWWGRRHIVVVPALLGLPLLALAFVISSAQLETTILDTSFFPDYLYTAVVPFLRLLGYLLLGVTLLAQRIQPEPIVRGYSPEKNQEPRTKNQTAPPVTSPRKRKLKDTTGPVVAAGASTLGDRAFTLFEPVVPLLHFIARPWLLPPLAVAVALGYLWHGRRGLERHLLPLSAVFLGFAAYEAAALTRLLRNTTNPTVQQLVAPFGLAWLIEHAVLLATAGILVWWVGRYLLRRLRTQLMMVFTSMALGIFLVTTVTFSLLLQQYIEQSVLENLATDAKVLRLVIERTQRAVMADAESLARDSRLVPPLTAAVEPAELAAITQGFLTNRQESALVVVNRDGQVLLRGEQPQATGGSLSDNPLVAAALSGQTATGFARQAGSVTPLLSLQAAAPVYEGETVVGAVLVGEVLDTAFVDGVKRATGLDAALYIDNVLTASTITIGDEPNRWIGIADTNGDLTEQARASREPVSGTAQVLNVPYLATYLPLLSADSEEPPVGLLFVGVRQLTALQTAGAALQLTFVAAAVLMLFSIFPSLAVASLIKRQVR